MSIMAAKKRISRNVWVVFILVFVLVIQVLFDPLSGLFSLGESIQARIGLPLARSRWEAQDVNHYKFDIQGYVPLLCIFGGNIEVKNGAIIHTGPKSDFNKDATKFLTPGFSTSKEYPLCNYKTYTVPLLFDLLEQSQQESFFSVSQVSFDRKYGFISSLRFGYSGGWGLLSPRIGDCCSGFRIENFQVLDE